MFNEYILEGKCLTELNTEMRFNIADARADKAELVRFSIPLSEDEKDNLRLSNCLIKILRSINHDGLIQFYVTDKDFENATTQAEFLINKYSDKLLPSNTEIRHFYIKM
ncbi:MAG: hypothetical protein IKC87_05980 [Clostridia bacterium]|nr:hypothetical protein [Clostridia bacterium]